MHICTRPWRETAIVYKMLLWIHRAQEQLLSLTGVQSRFIPFCVENDHFLQFNSLLIAETAQCVQADISEIIQKTNTNLKYGLWLCSNLKTHHLGGNLCAWTKCAPCLLAKREETHDRLTELYTVSIHLLQSTHTTNPLRIGAGGRRGERGGKTNGG